VGDPRNPRTGYFNFVYQPLFGSDGRPDGVIVFGFEVTEQVLARRGLEQTERRLAAITQNATLGLFLMDARQHCVFMNPAAEKITGFTLEELRGKPLHDFIHHTRPDGTPYPMAECPIDRALPTRPQEQGEDMFVRKDGSFYPVAFTASPLLEEGKATGTVIELRDTTEDKRIQAERERLLAELQEAVRLRDEFLSIASHELKTPLTPLSLRLQGLERTLAAEPDAPFAQRLGKEVEVMRRQVKRLSDLVSELLDVSRISSGRLKLLLEEVDLSEVTREVSARFIPEERAVSERHYGGLGLGLYVTRQIIVAMGGTVTAESLPDQGATFTVELPYRPPAQEGSPERGAATPEST
jgi:PAS domain S-box-containing protein